MSVVILDRVTVDRFETTTGWTGVGFGVQSTDRAKVVLVLEQLNISLDLFIILQEHR